MAFGWPMVITAYSLLMLLNTATMRETSDSLQEMARLIVSSMRKKEYDVDYSKLLGSVLPLPADYQHLLEAITSKRRSLFVPSSCSLRSAKTR